MESHSGKRIGHFRWILASGKCAKWRRGWDLNPRYGFPYARFRGEYFKPLSHLSAVGEARLADESAERQRCVMLRDAVWNPSGIAEHFVCNLAQRTILVG